MLLGDTIETGLSLMGITQDRVSSWLGKECHCEERKQRINQLDLAVRRALRGKVQSAKLFLEGVIDEDHSLYS